MNIINTSLQFKPLQYGNKPTMLILHHSASSVCSIEDVHAWHLNKGWAGIGYNYFVRKNGSVHKGRPETAIGANCSGYNAVSIGVCCEGNFNTDIMPQEQVQAMQELVTYLVTKHNLQNVHKHSDLFNTECPGNNFPFDMIVSGKVIEQSPNKQEQIQQIADEVILSLQKECNAQGFSSQLIDGVAGINTLNGCPTLRKGAKGNITRILQLLLLRHGMILPNYGADGDFGSECDVAVRTFQAMSGLDADGIVGQNTWRKLLNI